METKEKRPWYKKKRYLVFTVILGLIILSGLNDNSSSQVKSESTTVPSSGFNTQTYKPVQVDNSLSVPLLKSPTTSNNTTNSPSNDNYYTNVNGNTVHSPAYYNSAPVGASARCGDGTYSFSQNRRGTCSHHGGVADWL